MVSKKIESIDNLRAFCILCVVFSHTWWVSGQPLDQASLILLSVVNAGTYFFLFVSGFMFFKLDVAKFSYLKFLTRKAKNLGLPYLFISAIVVTFAVFVKYPYPEYFFSGGDGLWDRWVFPWFGYFFTGRVLTGYWYIPFIMLLFLLSPLYVCFARLVWLWKWVFFLLFLLLAGFVQRSIDNMNPFQALLAFSPAFLIGIIYGEGFDRLRLNPLLGLLIFFVASIFLYHRYDSGQIYESQRGFFSTWNGYEEIQIIKLLQVIGLLCFFDRFSQFGSSVFVVVAKFSFSIYFLHTIFIYILFRSGVLNVDGFFGWFFGSLTVFLACLGFSILINKILGKNSRYFIGA